MKQPGFFDVDEPLARLSGLGDQLEAFSRTVDFEAFRPDLERALAYADGSKVGRPLGSRRSFRRGSSDGRRAGGS